MKRLFLVIRLLMNERFSSLKFSNLRRSDGKLDMGQLVLFLVMAFGGGYLLLKLWEAQVWMANLAKRFAHPEAPSALIMLGMVTAILIGSMLSVLSKLYFRKSLVWFAHLPVSSWKVLLGVLGDIWITEIAISAVLMGPALYLYSSAIGTDVLFWVRVVWMLLAMPLLPLAIVTLIATLITWIAGIFRWRNAAIMLIASGITFLFMHIQMRSLTNIEMESPASFLMGLLMDRESVLKVLAAGFPPILWAFRGLEGNVPMMLLYTGVSVGSIVLSVFLVQSIFMKLVLKQSESAAKKRRARLTGRTLHHRSPFGALLHREVMEVLKTPVYIMNSLTGALIMPLMMLFAYLGIRFSSNGDEAISFLNGAVTDNVQTTMILLILSVVIGLGTAMNQAMATAVSREGKRRDLLRILPVSANAHITAKLLTGMLYNILCIAASGGAIWIILPPMGLHVLRAMALVFILSTGSGACMLTLDAVRPNLHWKSEMKLYKQSLTVFFAMIIGMVFLVLPIFIQDRFAQKMNMDIQLLFIFGIPAFLMLVSLVVLYTIGVKRYRLNMERGM